MRTENDFRSNRMLSASLSAVLSDVRRIRARLADVSDQVEASIVSRISDEQGLLDLYSAMATVRELSRSGEKRIAFAQSRIYGEANPKLRRELQRAYDEGAKVARFVDNCAPLINGRPSCCPKGSSITSFCQGWLIGEVPIEFCPFCGARLPEVP